MKRIATAAVVVAILLGAAIFYSLQTSPTPAPDPTPKPTPDKDPVPVTSSEVDGTLSLQAASSHGYLKHDESGTLYTAVDITARKYEGGERPDLNVALVIDRSGSMHGQKIAYAKRAAHTIVDMLSESDRLAIVSYSGGVSVDHPSSQVSGGNRSAMHRAIDEDLRAAGGTNLAGGYRKGINQVRRHKTDGSVNRVILLSDGKPTVGISSSRRLQDMAREQMQSGITLTSMGVGLDYNEDLMTGMANAGGGNYFFIERPRDVVAMFEKELEGLATTVAQDASLVLELPEGVSLQKLYGYPHRTSNGRIYVSLSDFFSEQTKSVFLELRTQWKEKGKLKEAVKISLNYKDAISKSPAHQSVTLKSVTTDDAEKLRTEVNNSVIARVQQIEVARSLSEAMSAYEKGDQQKATEVLNKSRQKMKRARRQYDLDDKKFDRVEQELESTEKTIEQNSAQSQTGRKAIKENKARGNMILRDRSAF